MKTCIVALVLLSALALVKVNAEPQCSEPCPLIHEPMCALNTLGEWKYFSTQCEFDKCRDIAAFSESTEPCFQPLAENDADCATHQCD